MYSDEGTTDGVGFGFVHLVISQTSVYSCIDRQCGKTHCTATRPSTPPTVYPEAVGVTATHRVWNFSGESIGAPDSIVGLFRSTKHIL